VELLPRDGFRGIGKKREVDVWHAFYSSPWPLRGEVGSWPDPAWSHRFASR
jgi:hypothetical protein